MWVAWLNLEAKHGQPPGEATMALFKRALPYCDAKKLYLALLCILEAHQLVRSMIFCGRLICTPRCGVTYACSVTVCTSQSARFDCLLERRRTCMLMSCV